VATTNKWKLRQQTSFQQQGDNNQLTVATKTATAKCINHPVVTKPANATAS